MNKNPMISVILPVYNAKKYLDEAINSILTQTFKDFEFIIINDGSTDNSLNIIEHYRKKDNRIVLISRENKGLISSLNEGIKKSKGKYIARMDADDISLSTRFEEQYNFLEKNLDIGVCGTWAEVFKKGSQSRFLKHPITHDELLTRLLFSVPFAHPSIMMRKELFDRYNLEYNLEYKNAEDYKFWLDISKYTKFGNIPKVLFKYRYLESSVSRQADNKRDDERFNTISKIFTEILDQLNIKNSEDENRLHFILGLNERIAKEKLDLKVVNNYIIKIINANKQAQYFDEEFLSRYLVKKYLLVVYYKIKNKDKTFVNAIFYKLFWMAVLNIIKDKVK